MMRKLILLITVVTFISCGSNVEDYQDLAGEYKFHFEDSVKEVFPSLKTGENMMYIMPNGDIRLDSSMIAFGVLEGEWSIKMPDEFREFTLDFGDHYGSKILRLDTFPNKYYFESFYFEYGIRQYYNINYVKVEKVK